MGSKVYCVTEPVTYKDGAVAPMFDITPALQFGDIDIVTKHNQSMFLSSLMVTHIRNKLKDFSDDDYILPVGDPTVIGTVCAIAADINEGRYKILKWDKKQRKYLPITVDIWGNDGNQ